MTGGGGVRLYDSPRIFDFALAEKSLQGKMCWVLFIPCIYARVFTGDARLDRSDDLGNVAKLNRLGSGALISGNTVQNIIMRHRAVARTLIGGVHIHIFMFCPTSFFSNPIQIDQFEKKSVGQNMNI